MTTRSSGYVDFLERFLDAVELQRVVIVGHGWGAVFGLLLALRRPERVSRLALIDAVPLLEGFSWPAAVRWWRRPGIGELMMGSVSRRLLARVLRAGSASPQAWPDERVAAVWEQFDQGTQRAILRLHRSVDVADLERPGARAGARDAADARSSGASLTRGWRPRSPTRYGARLAHATVERVPDAGHWPWLDRPEVVQRLAAFVHAAVTPGTSLPKRLAPVCVAAVFAATYVILSPASLDLADHLFRAQLFRDEGFGLWNNLWYSGHHIVGYSVIFPAVSALLTPQLAGALAATGTAALFEPLARRHFGADAWLGAVLFGAATAIDLYTGRLAFAFGALPALGAVVALDRGATVAACGLALLSALCSPVAALFAALIAAGYALGGLISARRIGRRAAGRRGGDRRAGAGARPRRRLSRGRL